MGIVERDIDDLPKNPANYTALTPLGFLERAALVHPTRKSVIHGSRSYTWQQTYRRCRQLASALAKRGVTFGSTVSDLTIFLNLCLFFFLNVLCFLLGSCISVLSLVIWSKLMKVENFVLFIWISPLDWFFKFCSVNQLCAVIEEIKNPFLI